MSEKLKITLQILVGLFIVFILYIITLIILNIDSIIIKSNNVVKPREETTILDGYAPVGFLANRSYNTFNQFSDNFLKMGKSVNNMGGSQFTYQFWIKIDDPDDKNYKNLILLSKGDLKKYKIGLYNTESRKLENELPTDLVFNCPLIKFVDSYRHLKVQFNTINNPLTSIDINMNPINDTLARRNALSLLPLNWYLMTFIFIDNFSPSSATENGIKFQFYLNDIPYQENNASDSVPLRFNSFKQNDGNLFLCPNPNPGNYLRLGNIKYFNYALNENEIRNTFFKGPPNKDAVQIKSNNSKPPQLSPYNKIDIYNY